MLKKMSCLVLCFLLLISDSSILVMATGESQTSGWVYENEHWYLYDSDGVMQTGWHKVGGNTYHLSETGEMTSGWLYEENSWYYFGAPNDGAMKTGWKFINGTWYYFDNSGRMMTGWLCESGIWYYLGEENDGAMRVGWDLIEDTWYYFEGSGRMKSGWLCLGNTWYYLGQAWDGAMKTGWTLVNGTWYCFGENGGMMSGWLYEEDNWYYLGQANDGAMATGGRYVNGSVYVFDDSGIMYANGTYTRNGYTFTADSSGAVSYCYTSNFPVVYQRPELPTGCEITALTMVLNYYGYNVGKTTMASNYLPQVASGYTGRVDLDYYFCGNPYGAGIGCGAGALVTAANSYFSDYGSSLRGKDITGATSNDVLARVAGGQPTVAMVTIDMANRKATKGWYTPDGKYVDWSDNDHAVAVIGWDNTTVTIACPLFGIKKYTKAQFEKSYTSRGNRAMILQ